MKDSERLLLLWRRDPVAWSHDVLEEQPREWQIDALHAIAGCEWSALAACRKAGKSRLAALLSLWWLTTRAESLVVTMAPVWSQVEQAIWAEIRHLWARSILPQLFPTWEVLQTAIKTPLARWRALGLASNDVSNIEGRHPGPGGALVILDESKGIPEEFFDSVQGMLGETGTESKLVAIGTPGPPLGWFYRAFSTERSLWGYSRRIPATEIPRLAARAEAERERLGEVNPWFRQQQLAEFAGADEFSVIPLDLIEAATRRILPVGGTRYMALDVAGSGKDDSVLTWREGGRVLRQEEWNGWDEMRTAERTARAALEFLPESLSVDAVGIGAGVASRIEQIMGGRVQVLRYVGGAGARDSERFLNRKSEDVFTLGQKFRDGTIQIPNSPRLIGELSSWRWAATATGKTKVVDPDDSPDFADSAMMAFAGEFGKIKVGGFSPAWM